MSYSVAKTWVCWDVNSCPVPDGFDARLVRPGIESVLKKAGCSGPLTIAAVGNLKQQTSDVLQTLHSTGILLKHTLSGFANILGQLFHWTGQNPAPATLGFITGDEVRSFSWILHNLHRRGYIIFLAHPKHLCSKMANLPEVDSHYLFNIQTFVWETLLEAAAVDSVGTSSETCETYWSCTLCEPSGRNFAGEIFEEFTMHLKSRGHALSELDMVARPRRSKLDMVARPRSGKLENFIEFYPDDASTTTVNKERSSEVGGGRKKKEMRYPDAKTWVCWDVNSCLVPDGFDARLVSPCIESALTKGGCSGPLTISAAGNLKHILKQTPDIFQTIFSTGILLEHSTGGFAYIFEKLLRWTRDNPPPATLMLITGDSQVRSYSVALYNLQGNGYTIFLVHPKQVFCILAIPEEPPFIGWETLLEDAMDSVARQQLNDNCEMTEWSCTVCEGFLRSSAGKSLEAFIMHLKSRQHALSELDLVPRPPINRNLVSNYINKQEKDWRIEEEDRLSL